MTIMNLCPDLFCPWANHWTNNSKQPQHSQLMNNSSHITQNELRINPHVTGAVVGNPRKDR